MIDNDNEAQNLQRPVDATNHNELKRKADWKACIAQRIYILTWIRTYDRSAAISDLIAGTTVGLTMIAQAIAYAALAGLPSQYGLYSAFVGNYIHSYHMCLSTVYRMLCTYLLLLLVYKITIHIYSLPLLMISLKYGLRAHCCTVLYCMKCNVTHRERTLNKIILLVYWHWKTQSQNWNTSNSIAQKYVNLSLKILL